MIVQRVQTLGKAEQLALVVLRSPRRSGKCDDLIYFNACCQQVSDKYEVNHFKLKPVFCFS